ncbi:MAG: hypothetical protein IT179_01795 [Acidobacteria bacterium]|nr:hypothetical protein [Acidobacteriota bacterium]
MDIELHRHPHVDLLTRAWTLRQNATAYHGRHVALAEAPEATIVTCGKPLAGRPGSGRASR